MTATVVLGADFLSSLDCCCPGVLLVLAYAPKHLPALPPPLRLCSKTRAFHLR